MDGVEFPDLSNSSSSDSETINSETTNPETIPSKKHEKQMLITNNERFNEIGVKTYKNNEVMRLISDVMSDTNFRELFDKNFNTWDDVKAILMIMKLYQNIEIEHIKNKGVPPDKMTILGAVKEVIQDTDLRLSVVNAMTNFMESGSKKSLKD